MRKMLVCLLLFIPHPVAASVLDEVLERGSIRCGYIVWPPLMQQDVATHAFSGMNYDYVEAIVRALDLKIEWALEVTPGQQIEALRSKKIDAICTAEGPMIPSTLKYLSYSRPIAYFPFYVYTRQQDMRFSADLQALNDPKVKIALIDGDVSGQVVSTRFANASRYPLPQLASPGQMMLDVTSGKADALISDPLSLTDFNRSNPGMLRRVSPQPVATVANALSVLRAEETMSFLLLLDQAIDVVRATGEEARIFAKYQTSPEKGFLPLLPEY